MVVEEPSVVAAASQRGARWSARAAASPPRRPTPIMIGQVQVVDVARPGRARSGCCATREPRARRRSPNSCHPTWCARRRRARHRGRVSCARGRDGERCSSCTCSSTCRDAMGANLVNTHVPRASRRSSSRSRAARSCLRILSNLADRRSRARTCTHPGRSSSPATGCTGEQVARRHRRASRFARVDPYRAATHNKGIMNGIDAVAIATGQRLARDRGRRARVRRRDGQLPPLTTGGWTRRATSCGRIELPLALGIVGGAARVAPGRAARAASCSASTPRASSREVMARGRPRAELRGAPRARHRRHPEGPHGAARALRASRRPARRRRCSTRCSTD